MCVSEMSRTDITGFCVTGLGSAVTLQFTTSQWQTVL
jgi:hypothetical protein